MIPLKLRNSSKNNHNLCHSIILFSARKCNFFFLHHSSSPKVFIFLNNTTMQLVSFNFASIIQTNLLSEEWCISALCSTVYNVAQLIISFSHCLSACPSQPLKFKVWPSNRSALTHMSLVKSIRACVCVGAPLCLCRNTWCLSDSLDLVLHHFAAPLG